MTAANQELILPCECNGLLHVLRVTPFDVDGSMCIEFLAEPRTFWERVRAAWRAFRGHELIQDVVLSRSRCLELGSFLLRPTCGTDAAAKETPQ